MVELNKSSSLEAARSLQRNFVADYLKKRGEKDAALVAYYNSESEDWRFSLVRMEYHSVLENDKVQIKTEFTPARRFSFLVGANEPNHTAQQQLVPLLSQNKLSLDDLEEAFKIESVTQEFFDRYKALFLNLKEKLELNPKFPLDSSQFAKKLLGQIVFLYFIQKKGWLVVYRGQAWGNGSKDFLQQLFRAKNYDNYHHEILEPLLYTALAKQRSENFYEPLQCYIPFLNGGLFEADYDWVDAPIEIDNATFGAIFDNFDLYNFTVREDEPLEREVAVDPEMLGKVFEKLLDVEDRKSKGAFYTPREIVHYMCQESLIAYLSTQVEAIPREDLSTFITRAEFSLEHDEAKLRGTKSYEYGLPESVRSEADAVDNALARLKICDPAIGSGAFPVGLMQEIVKARMALSIFLGGVRGAYELKRHVIQECIYGVDVDASAVDIAKLRLWLSLVVDEVDYESIKPLPNLDYKIVCGNSLLGVEKDLLNEKLFRRLESLKSVFFDEIDGVEKRRLKGEIDGIIGELTGGQFDFELCFSEVFRQGGFDVVIGNPPYGIVFDTIVKKKYDEVYPTFARNNDIYVAFYEKGFNILINKGILAYISPNTFLNGDYFKILRKHITCHSIIREIFDYKDLKVFKDPTVFVCVFIGSKNININYPYQVILKAFSPSTTRR